MYSLYAVLCIHYLANIRLKYSYNITVILVSKQRILRKKIFLEIQHFWDILPWKSPFFGHFPHDYYFCKQFNNTMSVTEKSFSKNHKFHGICVTTLIHYYKVEINHVIFKSKIFFTFSSFLCKEFKFFLASLQRMTSVNKSPIYSRPYLPGFG